MFKVNIMESDYQFGNYLAPIDTLAQFPLSPSSAKLTAQMHKEALAYLPLSQGNLNSMTSPPLTPGDHLYSAFSSGGDQFRSPYEQSSNNFSLNQEVGHLEEPEQLYIESYNQNMEFGNYQYEQDFQMGQFINLESDLTDQFGNNSNLMSAGFAQIDDLPYSQNTTPNLRDPNSAINYPVSRLQQMKNSHSDSSLASWNSNQSYGSNPPQPQQEQQLFDDMGQAEWQGVVEPGFQCSFPGCLKNFTKQTNLKSHFRIHQPERGFGCEDCPASFRRSHDLKRHQRSLHSDFKPFECMKCQKKFSRLVLHRITIGCSQTSWIPHKFCLLSVNAIVKLSIKFLTILFNLISFES